MDRNGRVDVSVQLNLFDSEKNDIVGKYNIRYSLVVSVQFSKCFPIYPSGEAKIQKSTCFFF